MAWLLAALCLAACHPGSGADPSSCDAEDRGAACAGDGDSLLQVSKRSRLEAQDISEVLDDRRGSNETLNAYVVAVNLESPSFPGPRSAAKTAVCISGGGSRSLSAAVGQLRALEAAGTLPGKVQAISSVSGGTWAASQYMFVNESSEVLLGSLTDPHQLTMEFLATPLPMMGATANASTNKILWDVIGENDAECTKQGIEFEGCLDTYSSTLWIDVISKAILGPYGLDDKHMRMAASRGAVANITARNPSLSNATVKWAVPRPDRPDVFVMNGVILAPLGYSASRHNVVSLQMSPDFVGSPYFPNNTSVFYRLSPNLLGGEEADAKHDSMAKVLRNVTVGGGFVEAFAFGGQQPAAAAGGELPGPVAVGAPSGRPFSLADAVGISSAAPAKALTQGFAIQALNPSQKYWPISPGVEAMDFTLGDGGNQENFGLLAMLQSGVTKSVVFINTATKLSPDNMLFGSFCTAIPGLDDLANAADTGLTCLFTHCHEITGAIYQNNQVFPTDKLQPLLCELEKLVAEGKPAVVKQTLDVLRNDWWGIAGGTKLEVVWFYNEKCLDFEKQLPEDTRAALAQGKDGPFASFPHYDTMFQNYPEMTSYTVPQISLLAAQTQYAVQQNKGMVCEVIGC